MGSMPAREEFLLAHQNGDGGWGYFPGRESRVEPTVYALRALGDFAGRRRGVEFLVARQDASGGLTPSPSVAGATWVTQLAFPVMVRGGVDNERLKAAANWIVDTQGAEGGLMQRIWKSLGKGKVDQDARWKGWPWRPGNNSWVEPTAHGLLALGWMEGYVVPAAIRYRQEMAVKMVLDRRCEDQGWNYGNKRVLGETLPSYPETTGLALLGLVGQKAELGGSLAKARQDFAATGSAYARALLGLALRLHGERVESALSEGVHPSRNVALTALELLAARGERKDWLP